MYSGTSPRALPRVGFPIRKSRDRWSVSTSPGLIAAAHVLHRLLAPRHPPCALVLLIVKNTLLIAMEFSRCAQAVPAEREKAALRRSLKTQQRAVEVDVISRRARSPDGRSHRRAEQPAGVSAPASLERR